MPFLASYKACRFLQLVISINLL